MRIIAPELLEVLKQHEGFVLLIKGKAGTGKTTLALEILGLKEHPIYISTRVTPKSLYRQFPWIKQHLSEKNILDATVFDLDQVISIDEAPEFFKNIQLQSFPDFVRILFSKINSTQTGTLVIDSWDAIAILSESSWGKSNSLLANYILELVRQKNFNLILIEETEQETYLDYLVDGIVMLKKSFIENNRLIRQLNINKLRGISVTCPSYLFSLYKGRFTTLLPTTVHNLIPSNKIDLIPDSENKFSTGIPDLDTIIGGGLIPGTAVLSDARTYLGRVHALIILRIAFQFLKQKRGVIAIPPPGRSYSDLVELLIKVFGDEIFKKCFRHVVVGEGGDVQPYSINIIASSPNDFFNKVLQLSKDLHKSAPNRPNWILISIDNLVFDFKDIKKEFRLFINQLKTLDDIIYFTAYSDNPLIEYIKDEVYNHFSLIEVAGKAVYYPKNLRTSLYALNFKNPENKYQIDLIPLV